MRTRQRFVVGILLCLTSACVSVAFVALAQTHGKPAHAKAPKPANSVTTDAAAAPEEAPAAAPSSADASAAPGSSARELYFYDGGARPSPLNPQAAEFPAASTIDAGVVDYDKLIGDISALRARVASVSDTLFHSKIAIAIRTDGRHSRIGRLVVSLDDGAVYRAPSSFHAEDFTTIYEHAAAPGRHAITVDVERKDDRDETFRTTERSRFIVDVLKDERLGVEIRVGDDSTMGGDFPADHNGRYDLHVRLKASSHPVGK